MTLEQFAARVRDIAGNEHCVAHVAIHYEPNAAEHVYRFEAYTETAGWVGVREPSDDPEAVLQRLADKQNPHRRTDPSGLRHDA